MIAFFQFAAEDGPDIPEMTQLEVIGLIGGTLIVIFTLMRMGRRRRARQASGDASPTPGLSLSNQASESDPSSQSRQRQNDARSAVSRDLQGLMAQLQDVTREVEGSLDTRIRFAQKLISECENASTRLEGLIAQANGLEHAEGSTAAARETSGDDQLSSAQEASEARAVEQDTREQDTREQDTREQIGRNLDVVSEPPSSTPAESTGTGTADRDQVIQLATDGLSPEAIASKVQRPIGEVELILSLHRASEKPKTP